MCIILPIINHVYANKLLIAYSKSLVLFLQNLNRRAVYSIFIKDEDDKYPHSIYTAIRVA